MRRSSDFTSVLAFWPGLLTQLREFRARSYSTKGTQVGGLWGRLPIQSGLASWTAVTQPLAVHIVLDEPDLEPYKIAQFFAHHLKHGMKTVTKLETGKPIRSDAMPEMEQKTMDNMRFAKTSTAAIVKMAIVSIAMFGVGIVPLVIILNRH